MVFPPIKGLGKSARFYFVVKCDVTEHFHAVYLLCAPDECVVIVERDVINRFGFRQT